MERASSAIKKYPAQSINVDSNLKVIAFLTDYSAVERIINHRKLTFSAERPPPPQAIQQEILTAAEYIT